MKVCMKKQTQKRWAWLLALVMCLSVIMPTSLMSARADGSSTVVKYEHNFTTQGVTSDDFFTIAGSAGKKKGTATYDGVTYTDPLKFDSKASVKFTAPEAGKLTLVFGTEVESAAGKNVKINGTKTKVGDDGVLTVDISAGDYTITKGDTMNLFYIVYSYTKQDSTEGTTKPTEETTKATEAATKPSETKPSETKPDTGDTTVEQVSLIQSTGWLESAYVEWNEAKNAVSYNVYVKKADAADISYEKLDNELVRKYKTSDGSAVYYRADALGLAAGSYVLKVVPVAGGTEQADSAAVTEALSVKAHDRTGFAWTNGEANGAYRDNGTLKGNAVVLYLTEETKDTVTMDVIKDAKGKTQTATGIQAILNLYKKGYDNRPLDIRLIGQVTDFAVMEGGDMVVSGSSSSKRLSCGITIEGVGDDATVYGWGIRIKNASNVEVRNLGIMLVDSSEGDNIGLQQDNDHIWVHNCDFFYGEAGGDSDQAKGDGALDCKKSTFITFSYNHFFDNGKCNLLGLSEGTTEDLYITYHHNWYDHSDSRHPRIRFYSAHVYNNYYDGNAKYGIGSTNGSSVFSEGNYFRNCKYPMLTSMQGSDVIADWTTLKRDEANMATFSKEAGGTIKAYNNYIEGGNGFVSYQENNTEFDGYVVESADEKVPATVKSYKGGNTYNNFDTSKGMYSYTADTPQQAKENVEKYAGRVENGDFKWTFTAEDDASYALNQALKSALRAYKTCLVSVAPNNTVVQKPYIGTGAEEPTTSHNTLNKEDMTQPASKQDDTTKTTESTKATEATKATESTKATDSTKATEATKATDSTKATEATKATDSTKATEGTKATESTTGSTTPGQTTGDSTSYDKTSTAFSGAYTSLSSVSDSQYLKKLYAAPQGSASADGTKDSPLDLESAIAKAESGTAVILLEGTYAFDHQVTIPVSNSGTADCYKVLKAADGAKVTFDFSSQSYDIKDTSVNARGLQIEGNYWYVYGITVYGAADNGIFVAGSHNVIERCILQANRDTGLQISRRSSSVTNKEDWPSYNYIINCTSFDNCDPATGENADGFAAKLTCGEGNVFDGCISYCNCDDGWDLYAKPATGSIGVVTIRNCIAFNNGTLTNGNSEANGDMNGFKLGGSNGKVPTPHFVFNCLAFNNGKDGFTDNGNGGALTLMNCTSYNNAKTNFNFYRTTAGGTFFNLLSAGGNSTDKFIGKISNSISFNSKKYYQVPFSIMGTAVTSGQKLGTVVSDPYTSGVFTSTTAPDVTVDIDTILRNADGSLTTNGYLMSTGDYQSMGAKLGVENQVLEVKASIKSEPETKPEEPTTAEDKTEAATEATKAEEKTEAATEATKAEDKTEAATEATKAEDKTEATKSGKSSLSEKNDVKGAEMSVSLKAEDNVFDEDDVMQFTELTEGSAFDAAVKALSDYKEKMVVVDISILRGTEFVHQFPGGVEVTLDIPAGYEEANVKVFRMEEDGTATDMQAVCKNGKAVFVTNHFSTYVIAEQAKTAQEAPKVVNENISTAQTEAAKAENAKTETVKTGDTANAGLYVMLMAVMLIGAGVLIIGKRKDLFTK